MAVTVGVEEDLANLDPPIIHKPLPMALVGEVDPGAKGPAEGEVPATSKTATPPKLILCKKAIRLCLR